MIHSELGFRALAIYELKALIAKLEKEKEPAPPDDERTKLAKELYKITCDHLRFNTSWHEINPAAQVKYFLQADHAILREKRAVLDSLEDHRKCLCGPYHEGIDRPERHLCESCKYFLSVIREISELKSKGKTR